MTGIFYGSTMGTTGELAVRIAEKLNVSSADVYDVGNTPVEKVRDYDFLILGSSTWGDGELQDDWYDFIEKLKKEDLSGKKVALFGCGDCVSYPDTFCDAIGIIYDELADTGCQFIGTLDYSGYSVSNTKAFRNGKVLGLAIDENNESDLTESRLNRWADIIKNS